MYYVDPDGDYDDTTSGLTRQQYQDYIDRFQPTEKNLIGLATNNDLLNDQLDRNKAITDRNLNQANSQAINATAKFGLGDKRTEQQKRNVKLNNALSLASMNNNTRQALGEVQLGIMTGASTGDRNMVNKLGGTR